jgi:hypothetical protein
MSVKSSESTEHICYFDVLPNEVLERISNYNQIHKSITVDVKKNSLQVKIVDHIVVALPIFQDDYLKTIRGNPVVYRSFKYDNMLSYAETLIHHVVEDVPMDQTKQIKFPGMDLAIGYCDSCIALCDRYSSDRLIALKIKADIHARIDLLKFLETYFTVVKGVNVNNSEIIDKCIGLCEQGIQTLHKLKENQE